MCGGRRQCFVGVCYLLVCIITDMFSYVSTMISVGIMSLYTDTCHSVACCMMMATVRCVSAFHSCPVVSVQ